jgi:hypothetical protein
MKHSSVLQAIVLAALALATPLAGQQKSESAHPKPMTPEQRRKLLEHSDAAPGSVPPPIWTYTVTASRDENDYNGTAVGRSPYARGKTTTYIPTVIVPLIVTVKGLTNDPTAVLTGSCAYPETFDNSTPVELTVQSPVFTATTTDWIMDGQNIGPGQYIDAFRRAEFWSLVQGSSYHTVLSPVTVAAAVTVPATAIDPTATTAQSPCLAADPTSPNDQIVLGSSDTGIFPPWLEGTLIPKLRTAGTINSGELVYFLFYNVTFSDAYGYHTYLPAQGNQTYAISFFNGSQCCYPDIKTLAHEVGEWMDDPYPSGTQNLVPLWATRRDPDDGTPLEGSKCSNLWEVGDPSSVFLFPGVPMPNGVTYNPQELTFFSWFYGAPSIAAGGQFSNNNTFTSDAGVVCVPPPPPPPPGIGLFSNRQPANSRGQF